MLVTLFFYGGLALICLVAVQMLVLLAGATRRLGADRAARQLQREILLEQQAIGRLQYRRAAEHVAPWSGSRKFQIVRKTMECAEVCSFYLKPHDNKPVPAFLPGQYLTFELAVPGSAKRIVRCYSLSDRPGRDYYRVTIKRLMGPRDKPDIPHGLGSSFFHEHLKEGDTIDVRAPGGGFYLDLSRESPVVLISGGVGVTPMLSMLNEIVESGSKRETWFFFGVRNRGEHIAKEHLEKIARENENVHLHVCYSQPGPEEGEGKDFQHSGRVSIELIKQLLPSNNYDYYLCGPGPFMESITTGLTEWGVPDKSVHTEAFGPASVKKTSRIATSTGEASAAGTAGWSVEFARSGQKLNWKNPAESVLELAEGAQIAIDFGCRAGSCGTCKVAIKSGKVKYLAEPGCEIEAGSCLTCCCIPETDLVLDA